MQSSERASSVVKPPPKQPPRPRQGPKCGFKNCTLLGVDRCTYSTYWGEGCGILFCKEH